MPQHNLLTAEELSIIDSKLALPHRTQEDWAAIKAFLPDRDVIVMESQDSILSSLCAHSPAIGQGRQGCGGFCLSRSLCW